MSGVTGEYKDSIDEVLSYVDKDSEMFEVGSATGRDADYIESLGFQITRSDVVESFVSYQKSLGKEMVKFDLLSDTFKHRYDLIYTNAVLLHFNPEELVTVLENVKNGLKSGGLLAFTTKAGNGEGFSSHKMNKPRYFKYWQVIEIENILTDLGFKTKVFKQSSDLKWILGIVKFEE